MFGNIVSPITSLILEFSFGSGAMKNIHGSNFVDLDKLVEKKHKHNNKVQIESQCLPGKQHVLDTRRLESWN